MRQNCYLQPTVGVVQVGNCYMYCTCTYYVCRYILLVCTYLPRIPVTCSLRGSNRCCLDTHSSHVPSPSRMVVVRKTLPADLQILASAASQRRSKNGSAGKIQCGICSFDGRFLGRLAPKEEQESACIAHYTDRLLHRPSIGAMLLDAFWALHGMNGTNRG